MAGQVLMWATLVSLLRATVETDRGHWVAVIIFLIIDFVWVTTVPTRKG